MAPLQATDRNIIICQFIFALILACSRTPFSSQSLLLQQHPVISRNLDFDRSGTIFTPLCPGVLHTVYHLLPKASAFLKALSQKKEIRVKLPCIKESWWGISTFVLTPHLRWLFWRFKGTKKTVFSLLCFAWNFITTGKQEAVPSLRSTTVN